jgi:hypothetical protein
MADTYYCIDLDSKRPEVLEYGEQALAIDLKEYQASDPLELQDFDRRVFKNDSDAEQFLDKYNAILNALDLYCRRSADAPCILYKRRYIVLAILGLKTYTERHYRKDWQPGQIFYFHDQTYFLRCRLKSIVSIGDGYRYHYDLA